MSDLDALAREFWDGDATADDLGSLAGLLRRLDALGLHAHINTRVPANDGGISLGQAALLRERLRG